MRKECKEHSIVCISALMIINKIVLVVHWCYWLFSHGLKFYWIYCSLKWMPDHAKEYSFDVIEITMRANEKLLLTNLNFARRSWKSWNLIECLQLCRYPCWRSAFRAMECRLAQMNVFSHYCLTFSANDCVFSLNEQQKVYNLVISWLCLLWLLSGLMCSNFLWTHAFL